MIKYVGIPRDKCDMCSKYIPKHSYQLALLFPKLYPDTIKTDLIVCENCAQREAGKKQWPNVKRGGKDV